ncbi:DUF6509 family protein [Rossellomorea aquimaris]|uniref:DUF6509 family protein n=1 Tax=Rossellomorea aquimaris TaxID=189382 RepID=UPI001CD3DA40|nr:DUF6509 family protein [Rossellomorea aquimaris]MCA1053881.1 DUF6509 family protein [Rossellomorea aquimaris]
MKIIDHTMEELKDPTGILSGKRYEVLLSIEVPEDDELYSEQGLSIKAIFVQDEEVSRLAQYQIIEKNTESILDFELEEDEEAMILQSCKEAIEG